MRLKLRKAQSMVEYVVIFAALTALAGVTLLTIFSGSGQFQGALENLLKGS